MSYLKGGGKRMARVGRVAARLGLGSVVGLALVGASPIPLRALTIVPFFSASVTAGQMAVINNAITFYQSTFSDPITVKISFNADATCGLGCSTTGFAKVAYSTYRADLGADATSADDATALANTPVSAVNPVNGSANINLSTANARAVGINVAGFVNGCTSNDCDGAVRFNPNNTSLAGGTPGFFSLLSVIEHEIDEVLGTVSDAGQGGFFSDPSTADLFRWSSPGVRNFNAACGSYFSINGGATNLDPYNCVAGADLGDWANGGTPQVQDAFGTTGANAFLTSSSVESTVLDVVGYTRTSTVAAVPEPGSLMLLGTGLSAIAGAGFRRRKRQS